MSNGILEHGQWNGECSDEHKFDEKLAERISTYFSSNGMKSVLDLGCGPGQYTRKFRADGLTAHGVDGNPTSAKFEGNLQVADLAVAQTFTGEWDVVMSLEVGEHIPKAFEQTFLDNITRHAKKQVVLSWGVLGQGGYGHVNCQTNEYIIEEMKKRGFRYLEAPSQDLRKNSVCGWFKNTIMVFERE